MLETFADDEPEKTGEKGREERREPLFCLKAACDWSWFFLQKTKKKMGGEAGGMS